MNFLFFPDFRESRFFWGGGGGPAEGAGSALRPFRWPQLPLGGLVAKGTAAPIIASDAQAVPHTKDSDDPHRPGQPEHSLDARRRGQDLRLLLACKGGRRARRHRAAALLDEGAVRKPAALRGRQDGHARRPPGDGRLAEGAADRARDPVPAGARADAGLHRRSGGGRPCRDARRDDAARRPTRRRSTRWSRSTSSSTTA